MAIDLLTYEFLKRYVEGSQLGQYAKPQGVWNGGTVYSTGDYVTHNNTVYIVPFATNATSDNLEIQTVSGTEPGFDNTKWQKIAKVNVNDNGISEENFLELLRSNLNIENANPIDNDSFNNLIQNSEAHADNVTWYSQNLDVINHIEENGANGIDKIRHNGPTTEAGKVPAGATQTFIIRHGAFASGKGGNAAVFGGKSQAVGTKSFATGSKNIALGVDSFATGSETFAKGQDAFSSGNNTSALGNYSHTEGQLTVASGNWSHAEGQGTLSTGDYSHVEGTKTEATKTASHAEGYETFAKGIAAHSEGSSTEATGDYSHAEGYNTEASATYAHAEGGSTKAAGEASHSEGVNCQANGNNSHAEGNSSIAGGKQSHAEGTMSEALGNNSHAEGNRAKTYEGAAASHAEGNFTVAGSAVQHVQGQYNIIDTKGKYLHIIGNGTSETNRKNAMTVDWKGNAEFAGDIIANGEKVVTESKIQNLTNLNIENGNSEYGANNLQQKPEIKNGVTTTSWSSQNEQVKKWEGTNGQDNSVINRDGDTIYVGAFAIENGGNAAVFGGKSQASGGKSFAAGSKNIALGNNSAAFGNENFAAGQHSFTAGQQNAALGNASFAAGDHTIAINTNDMSIGYMTTATGHKPEKGDNNNFHPNYRQSYPQFVIGRLNTIDNDFSKETTEDKTGKDILSKKAFIVGGGTEEWNGNTPATYNRKNVASIDYNGNMELAGDLTFSLNGVQHTLSSLISKIATLEKNNSATQQGYLYGDIDGDGELGVYQDEDGKWISKDAAFLAKCIIFSNLDSLSYPGNLDFDNDGSEIPNESDVAALTTYVLTKHGLI